MNNYDIIFAPVITEKTAAMEAEGKYVFKVDVRANKTQIKDAVEQIFGVEVAKVNTANYDGKVNRMGRYEGRTSGYKKAIVTLTENSKAIEFFDSLA